MSNPRPSFSQTTLLALLGQVNQGCPLCARRLFVQKGTRSFKRYEIAHIYPLNPKPDELLLLASEEKLSLDVNHEDNLIPLCIECHTDFDNPRTVEAYRRVYAIKNKLINQDKQKELINTHQIEQAIGLIIKALLSENNETTVGLDYDPKAIDRKLNGEIQNLTKRKIQNYVEDYYAFVRRQMAAVDSLTPGAANLIATQVKLFYLKQKSLSLTQQETYQNIVGWLAKKSGLDYPDAAEIVASFFIQNCEVFE